MPRSPRSKRGGASPWTIVFFVLVTLCVAALGAGAFFWLERSGKNAPGSEVRTEVFEPAMPETPSDTYLEALPDAKPDQKPKPDPQPDASGARDAAGMTQAPSSEPAAESPEPSWADEPLKRFDLDTDTPLDAAAPPAQVPPEVSGRTEVVEPAPGAVVPAPESGQEITAGQMEAEARPSDAPQASLAPEVKSELPREGARTPDGLVPSTKTRLAEKGQQQSEPRGRPAPAIRLPESVQPRPQAAPQTSAEPVTAPAGTPSFPDNDQLVLFPLRTGETYTLNVLAGRPVPYTSFPLKSPPRHVVDILGTWQYEGDKEIPVDFNGVTRVRMGVHRDKIRLVFDLQDPTADPRLVQNADGLSIIFSR